MVMASVTWLALPGDSITSSGWGSMRSGSRRSFRPPWQTLAMMSRTIRISILFSAPSKTLISSWPRPIGVSSKSSSIMSRTIHRISIPGSWPRAPHGSTRSAIGICGRTQHRLVGHPTTGSVCLVAALGNGIRNPVVLLSRLSQGTARSQLAPSGCPGCHARRVALLARPWCRWLPG